MNAIVQDRPATPDVPRFMNTDVPRVGRDGVPVRPRGALTDPCGGRMVPTDVHVARLNGDPWRPRT